MTTLFCHEIVCKSRSVLVRLAKAVLLCALLLPAACTTQKPMYYWGSYEELIYDMYANPGQADPTTQIEKLTATIQQAQAAGMPVLPGVFAHLGMLYAMEGNGGLAMEAFNEEKTKFPESATFVDGLLARSKLGPTK